MDWSLVGLWLVQLFAVKEQIKVDWPPDGSSESLSLAVKEAYFRTSSKSARYKPNLKDKLSATQPILIKATEQQNQAVRKLKSSLALFP